MSKRVSFLFFIVVACMAVIIAWHIGWDVASADQKISVSHVLVMGDTGSDVVNLQKILNMDASTRVAAVGPGSPGNETAKFGTLTKSAVIRFQNKYPDDILTPAGISSGNGRVGPLTLKKINDVADASAVSKISLLPTPTPVSPQVIAASTLSVAAQSSPVIPRKVLLFAISPLKVRPGDTVVIHGLNFSYENNTVTVGSNVFSNVPSSLSQDISLTLPATFSPGTYPIQITSDGIQAVAAKNAKIAVTVSDVLQPAPSISSISPDTATSNDQITLTGTNFAANNMVMTSAGYIQNVPSYDGKTLVFKLSQASKSAGIAKVKQKLSLMMSSAIIPQLAISIFVQNDAGSSGTVILRLK